MLIVVEYVYVINVTMEMIIVGVLYHINICNVNILSILPLLCTMILVYIIMMYLSFVTGFEKIHLPCTQQQDTLFIINNSCTHISTDSCPGYFCCGLFLRLVRCPRVFGRSSMAPSPLDKQTAGCNSPHDWLMRLAMDLAALCDIWMSKWHQWTPSSCFQCCCSLKRLPTHPHHIGVLGVLATAVKSYLKWWAIQLATHSIVG